MDWDPLKHHFPSYPPYLEIKLRGEHTKPLDHQVALPVSGVEFSTNPHAILDMRIQILVSHEFLDDSQSMEPGYSEGNVPIGLAKRPLENP